MSVKSFKCAIIVLDKGFVYHGDLNIADDGWCEISNAHNIRKYGTERGLGQLALSGPTSETALDPVTVIHCAPHVLQQIIPCKPEMWAKKKK